MATKRASKPRIRPRVRSRVERVEGDSREPDSRKISGKSAEHRKAEPIVDGMARLLDNGEILISAQFSEVVPVGRFAGITIGPYQLAWKLNGVDLSELADIDWDDDDPLTDKQQAIYDKVSGALRSTSRIVHNNLDDDREIVDEAVKRFNEREIQEEKKTSRRR